MRVDSISLVSARQCQNDLRDQTHHELVNRPFQFHKRSPLFIGANDETLSVAVSIHAFRGTSGRISRSTQVKGCE